MADPARSDGGLPAYRPAAEDWADFRHAIIANARAVKTAAALVAARPGDRCAADLLNLACQVMDRMSSIMDRAALDERRMERLVAEQVDEELARYGIKRGALRAVPG